MISLLFIVGFYGCKSDIKSTNNSEESTQITTAENGNPSDDANTQTGLHESNVEQDSSQITNIEIESESNSTTENQTETETEQAPPQNIVRKRPKIEFEELTWDFGKITEGDIVEKKFKFTNTGNAPLEIKAANATCGCTRPSFPFLDIAPGESNFIGVKYNSVGKDGAQNPEVTIEANTIPKITTIKITGFVMPKTD